ncbi:hypothetical protein V8G54_003733 [Vigna mungo]|uniref:Uncharacterized protein n=1 Tax=Vigna mungo TaxID=3915 RepID=A0AAQ3SEI0_VIGMU
MHEQGDQAFSVAATLGAALLLYSEHHDPPGMDDLSTYEDDQYLHPFDNKHCIHHTQGKLHSAILDQFQCQDNIYYKLSQMLELLDCEDDRGPSLMNVWPALVYHTGNGFPGRDSEMPV